MAANTTASEPPPEAPAPIIPPYMSPSMKQNAIEDDQENSHQPPDSPTTGELGPLPPNWEKAYTENGEPYYIE